MAETIPTWENEETCLLRIADARGGAPFSSKDTPTISHERATVSSKDLLKTRVHLSLITKDISAGTDYMSAFRKGFQQGKEQYRQTKGIYVYIHIHQDMS